LILSIINGFTKSILILVVLLLGVAEAEDFRGKVLFMRHALALYTGCWRNELLGLKWGNVDFTTRMIYLKKTKSDASQAIPISEEARPTLVRRRHFRNEVCPETPQVFFTLRLLRGKK